MILNQISFYFTSSYCTGTAVMSIVVAEEGNRRVGDMSSAEASQCVLDIKAWFSRTDCRKLMQNGAESADIQRLEKSIDTQLPRTHMQLLSEVNGGMYLMDKELLSASQIAEVFSEVDRSKLWQAGLIPLCGDAESMLVIDTRRNDEVLEWDADDGVGSSVAPNLVRYLEDYRNSLLSGHFEYLDGIGVVEKMGGKPSRK